MEPMGIALAPLEKNVHIFPGGAAPSNGLPNPAASVKLLRCCLSCTQKVAVECKTLDQGTAPRKHKASQHSALRHCGLPCLAYFRAASIFSCTARWNA